jgi:hypothetical protein
MRNGQQVMAIDLFFWSTKNHISNQNIVTNLPLGSVVVTATITVHILVVMLYFHMSLSNPCLNIGNSHVKLTGNETPSYWLSIAF